MLATLTDERFSNRAWIFETKFDGIRCVAQRAGRDVRLFSRNRIPLNSSYPELIEPLRRQKAPSFILDGEIVALKKGLSSFSQLQQRMKVSAPGADLIARVPVLFYVFDVLYLNGRRVTHLPLTERKEKLRDAFVFSGPLRWTPSRRAHGEKFYADACRRQWEGLIAKKADSVYVSGRSDAWLKFKCSRRQEFVIGGFTDSTNPGNAFGALLLGYYRGGRLQYAGKVGTGFTDATMRDLGKRMRAIATDVSPFAGAAGEKGGHWIKPRLVAELAFTEWTGDGKLRHPSFVGLRTDKKPNEVVREDAKPAT